MCEKSPRHPRPPVASEPEDESVFAAAAITGWKRWLYAVKDRAAALGLWLGTPFNVLRGRPRLGPVSRIVIAPQDLRTSDPTAANDIYSGYFSFAGKALISGGRSPFSILSAPLPWTEELMGFGWLRHLRAADTALSRANARALIDDWINLCQTQTGIAWETVVTARRLISWISQSPFVLEGADPDFYHRFTRSLRRQTDYLDATLHGCRAPERRLRALIARCYVALATQAAPDYLDKASGALGTEIDRQILMDGGHISRNPAILIEILTDLLPLRQVYATQNAAPPPSLLNAIDRMGPMLRLFRHSDGALALFNGMGSTPTDLIATLIAYQDALAKAMENAMASGYQRLALDNTTLIMDSGAPPPEAYSAHAHAGCLSFEYADGAQRLIINCGSPPAGYDLWKQAARLTNAHSTLEIGGMSMAAPATLQLDWPRTPPLVTGPRVTLCQRQEEQDGGLTVTARHDGYLLAYGIEHERRITLKPRGVVTGQDSLLFAHEGRARKVSDDFALRFHLHPTLEASHNGTVHGIKIRAPNGRSWIFSCPDLPIEVAESISFATADGGRRSLQLVMSGRFRTTALVRWQLAPA